MMMLGLQGLIAQDTIMVNHAVAQSTHIAVITDNLRVHYIPTCTYDTN